MKRSPAPWTIASRHVTAAGDLGRAAGGDVHVGETRTPLRRRTPAARPRCVSALRRPTSGRCGCATSPAHSTLTTPVTSVRRRVTQHGHAAHRRPDGHHGGLNWEANATAAATSRTSSVPSVQSHRWRRGRDRRRRRRRSRRATAPPPCRRRCDGCGRCRGRARGRPPLTGSASRERHVVVARLIPSSLDSSPSTRSTFTHGKVRPMPAARRTPPSQCRRRRGRASSSARNVRITGGLLRADVRTVTRTTMPRRD